MTKPFQFSFGSILALMAWLAIVLAAWRSGLLQPTLMPVLFPIAAALGVLAVWFVVRRIAQARLRETNRRSNH